LTDANTTETTTSCDNLVIKMDNNGLLHSAMCDVLKYRQTQLFTVKAGFLCRQN